MSLDTSIPPVLRDKEALADLRSQHAYLDDMLESCWDDIGTHCKIFFPEIFRVEYTNRHQVQIDFVNDLCREQRLRKAAGKHCGFKAGVIGTRGLSKSTFFMIGLPSRAFLMGECPFFIPISNVEKDAITWSESLKKELMANDELKLFLGDIKDDDDEYRKRFGKAFWVATHSRLRHEMAVLPLGLEQTPRGKNYRGRRPILQIGDDMEDAREVNNPDIREKVRRYVDNDVTLAVNLLEEENDPYQIWMTDTVKHNDGLMEYLATQPDWQILRVPVCDENYKTLDPRFMTQITLDSMVSKARVNGTLSDLAKELMAKKGVNEYAPFKKADFRHYKESEKNWNAEPMTNVVIVDPSRTKTRKSDDTGQMVVGIDGNRPAIRVRDAISEKMDDQEIVKESIDRVKRYNALYLAVEFNGLGSWGIRPFQDALRSEGLYHVTLLDLPPRQGKGSQLTGEEGAKAARLRPLAAYYGWHVVYHNAECPYLAPYESSLEEFPNCSNWHLADCGGYILYAMTEIGISFHKPEFLSPHDAETRVGDAQRYFRHRKFDNVVPFPGLDEFDPGAYAADEEWFYGFAE